MAYGGSSARNDSPNTSGLSVKDYSDSFINQIMIWTAFYRMYIFMYVEHAMGIKLKLFQKLLLYCMDKWTFVCLLASRGLGKSWICAVYIHARCVLYPNSKVVIASGNLAQAIGVLEYVNKFRLDSDAVNKEIRYININKAGAKAEYWNGSSINIVASNDGARGKRANLLIMDEFRLINKDVIDLVLRKFKSDPRYCGWHDKPEYEEKIKKRQIKREINKELYLSSAWYKHHWSYKLFMSFFGLMTHGAKLDGKGLMKRSHFTCCLPYQLAVESGIKDIDALQSEFDEGVDEATWDMEYCCKWIGADDDDAFFKYDILNNTRTIKNVLYPPEIMEIVGDVSKEKFFEGQFKVKNEIRLLFCDIARQISERGENDNTSIGVMSLYKVQDKRSKEEVYLREVRYLETFEGMSTPLQALRIRKLYEHFDCDYIVIDGQNLGAGIIDLLELPIIDQETRHEYNPLNAINHDEMKLGTVPYPNAPKVIYGIIGSAPLNSTIAYTFRDNMRQGKIKMLVDETNITKDLMSIKGWDSFAPELKGEIRKPFLQISASVNEVVSLESKYNDKNDVTLKEKSGFRKDRYSSTSYASHFADILERKLHRKKTAYEEIVEYVSYFEY